MSQVLKRLSEAITGRRLLKEALLLSSAYFLYMFTRNLVFQDVEAVAFENAHRLISFETSLGVFWELDLQKWMLDRARQVVIFFNWGYIITFFPIIVPTAFILYRQNFRKYVGYRNIFLLSLFVGLMVFALFPLAPPRMISEAGFVDTIQTLGPSAYNGRESQIYYNALAAMPSLHFGWTVLFGVIFFRTGILWLRVWGVIYPSLTFFSIVVTGNHYMMDAVGGAGVVGIAFLINGLMVKNGVPLNAALFYLPVRSLVTRRQSLGRTLAERVPALSRRLGLRRQTLRDSAK